METGKLVIGIGVVVVLLGVAIHLGLPLGRLPGDIIIDKGNFKMYIPITTTILLSIIGTILFSIWKAFA